MRLRSSGGGGAPIGAPVSTSTGCIGCSALSRPRLATSAARREVVEVPLAVDAHHAGRLGRQHHGHAAQRRLHVAGPDLGQAQAAAGFAAHAGAGAACRSRPRRCPRVSAGSPRYQVSKESSAAPVLPKRSSRSQRLAGLEAGAALEPHALQQRFHDESVAPGMARRLSSSAGGSVSIRTLSLRSVTRVTRYGLTRVAAVGEHRDAPPPSASA